MTRPDSANARSPVTRLLDGLRRALLPVPAGPRVEAAIRSSEEEAEIIIGWIQMGGVCLFALLYLVSLGAFETEGVGPVPVILAIYGALTFGRIWLARRRRLTVPLITASSVLDIVVLMTLIWSFTLQHQAPPALYLKAPTLLYVFILISLRALRFDVLQLLVTGGAAMLGWAVLVAIAAIGPDGAPVTRHYPTYMTSLSLLWGAELDKIVSLGMVTILLALAVLRTRRLLVSTVVEQTAAADLSRFLDADAARQIRNSRTGIMAGDGVEREAAILFVDLRGFTPATAQLSPPAVISLLEDYHARFLPLIEAAGGNVDKFVGDGILVSFGATKDDPAAAARAFAAAEAILAESERWQAERRSAGEVPLGVAVAIAAGRIVYGAVGFGSRLELTVIGEAVNLAAKLEKHAKTERARVIATRLAFERARSGGWNGTPEREIFSARVEGADAPLDLVVLG
ncbi:MAG: adenylate/guanylate cyclase domain-containing protein [Alphaproteobacteria bacterium]|nr:adenylate/guanylate cyclase domain-containing protein [Alphaproteobacteria bacterium]